VWGAAQTNSPVMSFNPCSGMPPIPTFDAASAAFFCAAESWPGLFGSAVQRHALAQAVTEHAFACGPWDGALAHIRVRLATGYFARGPH
jgi:hypothetical protein